MGQRGQDQQSGENTGENTGGDALDPHCVPAWHTACINVSMNPVTTMRERDMTSDATAGSEAARAGIRSGPGEHPSAKGLRVQKTHASLFDLWLVMQRMVALIILILMAPLLALLYVLVKLDSPGPFIYVQERPGRFGRPFRAFKIRSMTVGADANQPCADP